MAKKKSGLFILLLLIFLSSLSEYLPAVQTLDETCSVWAGALAGPFAPATSATWGAPETLFTHRSQLA